MSLELVDDYRRLNMATAEGVSESLRLVEVLFKSMDRVLEAHKALNSAISAESKTEQESIMSSVEKIQPGERVDFATGYLINPLESAIGAAASIITDHPACAERLTKHLDDLLLLQLKQLGEPVRIECSQVGDMLFTELCQGRQ